jgi:hypothetical protein
LTQNLQATYDFLHHYPYILTLNASKFSEAIQFKEKDEKFSPEKMNNILRKNNISSDEPAQWFIYKGYFYEEILRK